MSDTKDREAARAYYRKLAEDMRPMMSIEEAFSDTPDTADFALKVFIKEQDRTIEDKCDQIEHLEAEIALLSANNKEITNALIKSGSEVALRGERLEKMINYYTLDVPENLLDWFTPDGKYIGEGKEKTCECRIEHSILDEYCVGCGKSFKATGGE